tara:strand:+ start:3200 stop:3865 length:666 start_codon:yes stop_codon:yes gene_type:complete
MRHSRGSKVKWRSKKKDQHIGEVTDCNRRYIQRSWTEKPGKWNNLTKPKVHYYQGIDGWNYKIKWPDGTTSEEVSGRTIVPAIAPKKKKKDENVYFAVDSGDVIVQKHKYYNSDKYSGQTGSRRTIKSGFMVGYPNFEFNASLKFITSDKWSYNSSVIICQFEVADGDLDNSPLMKGSKLAMRLEVFNKLIANADMKGGVITGKWTFKKDRQKMLLIPVGE